MFIVILKGYLRNMKIFCFLHVSLKQYSSKDILFAGQWYDGTCDLEEVLELLPNCVPNTIIGHCICEPLSAIPCNLLVLRIIHNYRFVPVAFP